MPDLTLFDGKRRGGGAETSVQKGIQTPSLVSSVAFPSKRIFLPRQGYIPPRSGRHVRQAILGRINRRCEFLETSSLGWSSLTLSPVPDCSPSYYPPPANEPRVFRTFSLIGRPEMFLFEMSRCASRRWPTTLERPRIPWTLFSFLFSFFFFFLFFFADFYRFEKELPASRESRNLQVD